MNDPHEQLVNEISNLVGKHADWLDGRTFQRLAERVARGYFEGDDLDRVQLLSPDDVALADAMVAALRAACESRPAAEDKPLRS